MSSVIILLLKDIGRQLAELSKVCELDNIVSIQRSHCWYFVIMYKNVLFLGNMP